MPHTAVMNNRNLAILATVATVVFIVLNFSVKNAGTLFLILAIASGIAAVYLFSRPKQ